ncbi:MAG: SDR family NAD(P)-dependent oxidoreductase [Candidatus Aenigmatarchaeota archaeon]
MRLQDKVAIVTGASSGIGRATALKLSEEKAKVVVSDIQEEPREDGQPTHELIQSNGGEAVFVKADVSDEDDVRNMVSTALEEFGKLDIMVNNAGVCMPCELSELDEDQWDRTLEINLKGVYLGCKHAVEAMKGEGKIVNISSVAGPEVSWPELPDYAASKGGIAGLTRQLALDLGQEGININAIAPGPIDTEMLDDVLGKLGMSREQVIQGCPAGRLGEPGDIANTVAFLASEEADFITGQLIVVDGGYVIR